MASTTTTTTRTGASTVILASSASRASPAEERSSNASSSEPPGAEAATTTENTIAVEATASAQSSDEPSASGDGQQQEQRLQNNQEEEGTSTPSLLSAIKTYLNDADFRYRIVPRENGVTLATFGLTGTHSSYRVVVECKPAQDRVAAYVHCPVKVLPPKLTAAAELLMRVNYSLDYGNAELDFNDGEVRVRTCVDVEGGAMVPTMVKAMTHSAAGIMDRLFPHLCQLLFGGDHAPTPVQAYQNFCTNDTSSSSTTNTTTSTAAAAAASPPMPSSSTVQNSQ